MKFDLPFFGSRCSLVALMAFVAGCSVQMQPSAPRKEPAAVEERPATPETETVVEENAAVTEEAGPYEGELKPFIVAASASTVDQPKYSAEFAFDGDVKTRWASETKDWQWIEARFDRPVTIEKIVIHWETARAADFKLLLSSQSSNQWVVVGQRVDASGETDSLAFPSAIRARAMRIECDRRATEWGNSIIEVDIMGKTKGQPPEKNLLGWKVPPNAEQKRERDNAAKLLAAAAKDPLKSDKMTDDEFLDLVSRRAFDFFWYETTPTNGLTRDRGRSFESSEDAAIASVAAVGFGLSAYVIGAEHGWVSRADAIERTRATLKTFVDGTVINNHGFFPHFVNMYTGVMESWSEISTIDTALLLAGMITAMEYFNDPEITSMGRQIFDRVDWIWGKGGHPHFVSHGVSPDGRLFDARWGSTTEGILIYLLAMGSTTHPLEASSWDAFDRHTEEYELYRFVCEYGFQSIFRYQYPALWYDFRGRTDREGLDFFENATLATLAMRHYCIQQAASFPYSYGPDSWGLGAADGPGDRYMIYGFPPGNPYSPTDGTVIPYAIAGSMPFLPQHAMRALRYLYDNRHECWGKYGFSDGVNPSLSFVTRDSLGLDQGTILLGIENYRSGLMWKLFMRNKWIKTATAKIGWKTRPIASEPDGPVDLARDYRWRFQPGGGDLQSPTLDDSTWRQVVVPDFWEHYDPSFRDLDGAGWFRVTFDLKADRLQRWQAGGRALSVRIGAVDDADMTYLNGLKIGESTQGKDLYKKMRVYRIPASVLREGKNVLAIRVQDNSGKGGIWRTPVEIGPE